MARLTLSFLGVFQATLGHTPLKNFRSAKVEGLLVYLALTAGQTHARDVLAALFWPDEPDAVAKQNLRQSLFRLRRVLGDVDSQTELHLLVTRSTVQFNPAGNYSLDAADFSDALEKGDLETAVSLYHGELLPGFSCDSIPFDDWLRQERERLHRLALDALYQLTADNLTQADFQTAQQHARKQLAMEPWREEAHQQLMEALASLGERTAALAQYETCRTVLAEELGVEPSLATVNLAKRIQNAQFARPTSTQAADAQTRQQLKVPFAGRKTEYETLIKNYHEASQHGLRLVTVQGQAGIGKTRLTEQFVSWTAAQGADVLIGRAFSTSAGLSYQPITYMLRSRLERENAPEDLLSDFWLSQLTRLLPELRERYPDLPEPTQDETTGRQHLFEAITRLIQALADRQPLVLYIDDWHWADSGSLDLLHYAAVRWSDAKLPILIVLTLRQEVIAESADLQSWLAKLNHAANSLQLRLSELSQPETAELIQLLLQSNADNAATQFSDWLFAETDGQPLFLTETLKALVEDGLVQSTETHSDSGQAWQIDRSKLDEQGASSYSGPLGIGRVLQGVQEIVQGWLARITPQARGLLTAASILAQQATFDHLCRVATLDELQAIEALDELLGKQLLQEHGLGSPLESSYTLLNHDPVYGFTHQKVSDVVYAEAGTARRRMLHRRAFETLREAAASTRAGQAVPAADLARHALNASLLNESIRYSLIAGNEALDLVAVQVAISHYQTVWQLTEQQGWPETISGADQQTLFVGLGRAYELAEEWPRAQKTYEAMVAYAQSIKSAAMECLGLNRLATIAMFFDKDLQQAITLLEQAYAVAEQHGDQRGMAETDWNLAHIARVNDDQQLAIRHAEHAVGIARELGYPQLLARSLGLLPYIYANLRQWEQAEAFAVEANRQATAAGNSVSAAECQRLLGHCQMYLGQPQKSLMTLQETLTFSQQIEHLWGQVENGRTLAQTQLELGQYGQAIRLVKQAIEQAEIVGQPGITKFALTTWGIVQRTIMAFEASQKTFLMILAEFTQQGSVKYTKAQVMEELCTLHAQAGEWEKSHGYAKQTLLQTASNEPRLPLNLADWCKTEALLRGGDDDLARREVELLSDLVGENRRYRLPLLRSRAVLAQWDGDVAQAVTHLEAALALAREMKLPGEEWPILAELGKLYVEQGGKQKAQQAYAEAAVIIHRLADTIDDEALREGFLTAVSTRTILNQSQ